MMQCWTGYHERYRFSGCVNMKIHFCDLLDKAQGRISLDETKGDDRITVGVTLSFAPSSPCGCGWMIRRMACTYDNEPFLRDK